MSSDARPSQSPDGGPGDLVGVPDVRLTPPIDGPVVPPADGPVAPADGPLTPPADGTPPDLPLVPDDAGCLPVVAAASPDPWSVRLPAAGFGGIVTQQNGPYTDVLLKSPTDYIRIGARLQWGGSVVFFGLSANPQSNVIDANDTGRELQLALYDPTRAMQGCAHDASCQSGGAACPNEITFLGWNPVQGGDECGNGGLVLSHGQQGQALQLVVRPMHWNPDWAATTCVKNPCPPAGLPVDVTYTIELRFVTEHVVEVMSQVTSQETIDHPVTGQEFPTLYVSHGKGGPDLPLLLDAAGNPVTIDQPANDGFYMRNFTSPGPWVSWQNTQSSYGVALATDQGITAFQGWRGDGVTAPYFHNVRSQIAFGLGAGKTVRGLTYLALGGFATVKAELSSVLAQRPPFGWLDAPAADGADLQVSYTPGQSLTVAGWVLDTQAVASVTVSVDGSTVASLPVNKSRPDVCAVYPAYGGCPAVGFSGPVSTAGLGPCPQLLRVTATDADGNTTTLGERRLVRTP